MLMDPKVGITIEICKEKFWLSVFEFSVLWNSTMMLFDRIENYYISAKYFKIHSEQHVT